MELHSVHREDVKALLRKRYGSVARFERAKGLPEESVCDVLRGRAIERTRAAIVEELRTPDTGPSESGFGPSESVIPDDPSTPTAAPHTAERSV